jgi:hypothetical protein
LGARAVTVKRRLWIDVVVTAALLLGSGVWATRFWNGWVAQGGQPSFYQIYFEPAVMVACGRGFVSATLQPKPLEDFLWQRRDRFECRELPPDLEVQSRNLYQGAWIYLEYAVGWSWRLLGISWSRMGPLFGLLFAIVIALSYGIFRLGTNQAIAAICACALAMSPTHLLNLPHLRDYAKAPFTLALILILGLLVTRPVRQRTVLLLALAYGIVLGVGYGFRTDFLVALPVLVFVLFAFLEGRLTGRLGLKAAASALFLATFFLVSWPVLSSVIHSGGCQWHVALLGLQSTFDEPLGIVPAPYDFGHVYADGYVIRGVQGYARRTEAEAPVPVYCSHAYDVYSGRLIRDIFVAFPADLITRAYASVLQVVELPFTALAPPMTGWAPSLYNARRLALDHRRHIGLLIVTMALLVVSAVSVRLGLFFVFCLGYFAGYPALQFQGRHYFHFEFITWWAVAFLLGQIGPAFRYVRAGLPTWTLLRPPLVRAAGLAGLTASLSICALVAARFYQEGQARRLLNMYVAAAKEPIDPAAALSIPLDGLWPQFVEVDLDQPACAPSPAVTFHYDAVPDADFTRRITIARQAPAAGPTKIFLPVFERYRGLDVSGAAPGCLVGAYRFTDLKSFPLLLGATLPPGWTSLPLYQRLAWERRGE